MEKITFNHVSAMNTISRFLANEQVLSLTECDPVDAVVLAGNSILPTAEHVFSALETRPGLAKVLVICGGIGHSTALLYQSIARHPVYASMADSLEEQPEAITLNRILEKYYCKPTMVQGGLQILIEDKSTNCGSNAIETKKILEKHGINSVASMIIVQDPTMSLRTLAAFEKVYSDSKMAPKFLTCPTFVPEVALEDSTLVYSVRGIGPDQLWDLDRFSDLIMGEIPRLRDDEHGYGPRGKNFISHVDVPFEVETAWSLLRKVLDSKR